MNRYQTLGKRILALVVDSVVFLPLIVLYGWLPESGISPTAYLAITSASSLTILYNILLHWKYGQTLGKMVAKVKVVDVGSEGQITLKQSVMRDIFYVAVEVLDLILLLLLIAAGAGFNMDTIYSSESYTVYLIFIWLAVDILVCLKSAKHRALHDFIAGTVVVNLDFYTESAPEKRLEPPGPNAYEGLRSHSG